MLKTMWKVLKTLYKAVKNFLYKTTKDNKAIVNKSIQ